MSQWASMSDLERLQHSIRYGTDWQNKVTDPGLWAQAGFVGGVKPENMNYVNGTPKAPEGAPQRPEGVSQYVWDRVTNNTLNGLNVTSITNNPETREALVNAGYGDYVKGAYEKHMDENAGGMIGNGADPGEAWARAQGVGGGWYQENFGAYGNPAVSGANEGLTFGGSSGSETTYDYPPSDPTGGGLGGEPAGGTDGGSTGGDTGGDTRTDLDTTNVGTSQEDAYVRNRNFGTVDYGERTGPAVNTGIGTAGPATTTNPIR